MHSFFQGGCLGSIWSPLGGSPAPPPLAGSLWYSPWCSPSAHAEDCGTGSGSGWPGLHEHAAGIVGIAGLLPGRHFGGGSCPPNLPPHIVSSPVTALPPLLCMPQYGLSRPWASGLFPLDFSTATSSQDRFPDALTSSPRVCRHDCERRPSP